MTNEPYTDVQEPIQALAVRQPDLSPLPETTNRVGDVNAVLFPAYQKASTLELTDDERKAIMAPFDDAEVEIRPHDGLLYIPHIAISDRLCQIFGPGKWCTVRRREWIEGTRIYAEWVLLIRGCFVGESVGAMDYHPNNAKMNYSDALEGTRGECIRRIAAKELGCGSQVWRPAFCRTWTAKYGVKLNGKWERRLEDYKAPEDLPRSQRVQSAKVAPSAKQEAKTPVIAPEKLKARFIELIEPYRAKFVDHAIKAGWLLETEGLDDLDPKYIPQNKPAMEKLFEAMGEKYPEKK